MRRTVRLRLKPTPEQRLALLETVRLATACFNTVAAYGWKHDERNSIELHKATYYPLRVEYPALPSQLVVSTRMRAGEAITSTLTRRNQGRTVSCPSAAVVPIRYDARSYRMLNGAASLASVTGRQIVAFATNPHAAKMLSQATRFDSADLILRTGKLWLHTVVTVPEVAFEDSGTVVGIDLGLNRPAVVSNRLLSRPAVLAGHRATNVPVASSTPGQRHRPGQAAFASIERKDGTVSAGLRPRAQQADRSNRSGQAPPWWWRT